MPDEMRIEDNPFVPKPEDYFEEYNEENDKGFDNKAFKHQELTYRLFTTQDGIEWLKNEKLDVMQKFIDLGSKNADLYLAMLQGVRVQLHNIEQMVLSHKHHLEGKG
jgi:hypothetical protein